MMQPKSGPPLPRPPRLPSANSGLAALILTPPPPLSAAAPPLPPQVEDQAGQVAAQEQLNIELHAELSAARLQASRD